MSDAKATAGSTTDASRIERVYADSEGSRWRVYEQSFGPYDRRTGQSLIFASDAAVRRVRDYPANWAEMSDVELAALSWKF